MDRREMLRVLGSAGIVGAVPNLWIQGLAQRRVPYQVYGSGPALLLGAPISVGRSEQVGDPSGTLRQGYLDRLTDRYRVIVMDYPPTGDEARAVVDSFTPDHVCADVLAVADAAGADRFVWWGYSWGGVVGLQLAARTNRLSALVCGGWTPLGSSYRAMGAQAERAAQRAGVMEAQLMVTFYRALEAWRDEDVVPTFTCPRLTFAGSDDVVIPPRLVDRRTELERMGWTVRLVDGFRHDLFTRPDVVVPLVRDFLDPLLLQA